MEEIDTEIHWYKEVYKWSFYIKLYKKIMNVKDGNLYI